jgi:hypothetical protein
MPVGKFLHTMSNQLDTALRYASSGWQVFPLKAKAKEPATRRGFYDATTNPATLRRWFLRFPYNLGIRTGTASNIFVLDVDGDTGFASLHELESAHGRLPPTLMSITARGRHYWFILDTPLNSRKSKIGADLDVKADGGYVLAPYSIHPSGQKYRWHNESIPPTHAPQWLIALARKKSTISERAVAAIKPPPPIGTSGNYGLVALDRECAALAATPVGQRNNGLNRASFRLHQLVAGGELPDSGIADHLIEACEKNGLVDDDGLESVKKTIASGRAAGLQQPRSRNGGTR